MIDEKNLGYALLRLVAAEENNGGTFQQHEIGEALRFIGGWTLERENWLVREGHIKALGSVKYCLTDKGKRLAAQVR